LERPIFVIPSRADNASPARTEEPHDRSIARDYWRARPPQATSDFVSLVMRAKSRRTPNQGKEGRSFMLRWAVIFLVIALVAALFGFTGIAAAAAGIAKFLFFLFLVICLIFLTIGISAGRRIP